MFFSNLDLHQRSSAEFRYLLGSSIYSSSLYIVYLPSTFFFQPYKVFFHLLSPLCRLARRGSRPVLVCPFAAMNQEEHSSASASDPQFPNTALQIGDSAGETTASSSRSTAAPRKRAPLASVACQDCRRRKTKVGLSSAELLGPGSY